MAVEVMQALDIAGVRLSCQYSPSPAKTTDGMLSRAFPELGGIALCCKPFETV